eukprot:CAMPEP_0182945490 /NCGR_PEP_ID=MMETSP0105_2-20130417/55596_1 /TAXON_ID=81532 ORGANISM="Acanthoeca-like sp., Strain 10tr" /NCGR_SAMPLE_ID=MMETSP0105_2 /ASSEMBLY_ACC=CAM_ASM_000205 /LENGTH=166 /DNA_ID=CAMNT_0025085515 /DNA_START=1 /DNA_END=501 /DNA_ORIENTATION=+
MDSLGPEPPMTRLFLLEWLDYNKEKWRMQRAARGGKPAPFNRRYVAVTPLKGGRRVGAPTAPSAEVSLFVFDSESSSDDDEESDDEGDTIAATANKDNDSESIDDFLVDSEEEEEDLPTPPRLSDFVPQRRRTLSEEGTEIRNRARELEERLARIRGGQSAGQAPS